MNKRATVAFFGAVVTLLFTVQAAHAAPPPATTRGSADSLDALLEPIREKRRLPGLVAAIVEGDDVVAIGAAGVRKTGAAAPITIDDKLHLGSCTKAMTATVLARLVERKQLAWDLTVQQAFPDVAPHVDAAYRDVTLAQLLTHRAGLPANGPWAALGFDKSTTEQRAKLIDVMLRRPPATRPATKFLYSNVGYAIAAAMGERVAKESWETMIRKELFDPLGMTSADFGAPGAPGTLDQPWGHLRLAKLSIPIQGDNPPILGPSGRVHCSIRDWAKFVSLHLRGARGEATPLLSSASFQQLHTPPPGEDYAFGWGVTERPWADGTVLTHSGSNTMWFCVVWIAPKKDFAVLAVTNVGGDDAARGCDDACAAMIGHYLKKRPATSLPTTRKGG